ncbi:hypothetical protein F4821DRAFT_262052 [Hypoxylon rubiginosum]|uniref:Uncharacterized protein n=1 Tax=Hypoxylon rubiginosum TaxID=110542 RepID=A0ACC0CV31_9PEZI|nr:hypothetical protein F4821DRAFT_262052 [Hypoxylon rubiginosum]
MSTLTATVPAISHGPITLKGSYGDWRDELAASGYAVIREAIPRERAVQYQRKALDWLTSFGTPLDLGDPRTWTTENLPVQSKLNTFDNYCAVHEKFMWDARTEPGVVDAFAKVWGTDELLVSFDSLNVTLPNRKDRPARAPWPHVDQSPLKRGVYCVQGIINLSPAGPEDGSLMCLPRSNALFDEFFDTQTRPESWEEKDWRRFSVEEMKWWAIKGLRPVKVEAQPGDLILWDSRTVHWGRTYGEERPLEEKRRVFSVYGATTHWAHDNIFLRPKLAHLPDGSLDPRNRDEPLERPELSSKLLKLAGIEPY